MSFTFVSGTGGGDVVNTANVVLLAPSSSFMALLLTEDVIGSVAVFLPHCSTNASYFAVQLLVVSKTISLVFEIICLDRVGSPNVMPISNNNRLSIKIEICFASESSLIFDPI